MKITITQFDERRHRTTILRDDGVILRVPGCGRPNPLPRDLARYVVEDALGLRRGFWATVAEGAKFPGMTILDGRQRLHADARSRSLIKANRRHLSEAEVLVDPCLKIFAGNAAAKRAVVEGHLKERWESKRPVSGKIAPDEVARACSEIASMRTRWQALDMGDSIDLQ